MSPVDPRFPGAAYATFEDVPPTCPRCGGPWDKVPDGVRCLLCGRRFVVATMLAAVMRLSAFPEVDRSTLLDDERLTKPRPPGWRARTLTGRLKRAEGYDAE